MGSKMGSNRVPKVAIPFEREAKTCLSKEREARLLKRVVEASGSIVDVRQREVETRGYTDDAECLGFGSK